MIQSSLKTLKTQLYIPLTPGTPTPRPRSPQKLFLKTLMTACKRLISPASDTNLYSDAKLKAKGTEVREDMSKAEPAKTSSNFPELGDRWEWEWCGGPEGSQPVKLNQNTGHGLWMCWLEQAQHYARFLHSGQLWHLPQNSINHDDIYLQLSSKGSDSLGWWGSGDINSTTN